MSMDRSVLRDYIDRSSSLIESSPQMDEQNTRRKLVEPFLELLGWDIVSAEVELEYSVQMGSGTKKVDYALLLEETPVVFVEAKGCDSDISDSNRRQLKSYMRQTGVDWGLLTNGTTFELFKRQTGSTRPEETSLGTFSLQELIEHRNILRAISRESIKSGEAETIAEHIEAANNAAETIRTNKENLSEDITERLIEEVGQTVSQTVEAETKQFLDSLSVALEERGKAEPSTGGDDRPTHNVGGSWEPSPNANAIAGTVSRAELDGEDDILVALFPTKRSGVEFLKENNAWAFVRIGRNPTYVAMYVSDGIQQIKYVARVKAIVSPSEANLARPLDFYSDSASDVEQAGFDPAKKVIVFEEGTLYELEDPIPYDNNHPQSLTYLTLGELKNAETTDDLIG